METKDMMIPLAKRCKTNSNDAEAKKDDSIITEQDVTIHLEHELDDEGEYGAFTSVGVDIFLRGKKVGRINGTRIDRERIPEHCFYYAMDSHSSDLQYVAEMLFEPRCGRTKLCSLRDQDDDPEFDILYIESLQVDKEYQVDGCSDLGTFALRKLLYHPYIKGDAMYGLWSVCSCVYVMNDMTPESRSHANQFLRNGLIQDEYLAREGGDRFLVAAYSRWEQPLKSHAEASAVRFYVFPKPSPPTGKESEILQVVQQAGVGVKANPTFQSELSRLIKEGGSLARCNALHVACASLNDSLVEFILEKDPSLLNSRDERNFTPLMVAAVAAAGSASKDGFPDEQPILSRLLAAGAQKELVNSKGMTAYGVFMQTHKQNRRIMNAMSPQPIYYRKQKTPGLSELQAMLMPPGGPTSGDRNGGVTYGFVDIKADDRSLGHVDSDAESDYDENGNENDDDCDDDDDDDDDDAEIIYYPRIWP